MFEIGVYLNILPDQIAADLRKQGYDPILSQDKPDEYYPPHSHKETNIIVVLEGTMTVTIDG